MSERVESILANYAGENPGVIGNLRRLMHTGRLAGTGKLVILPVDQGFEHGPARRVEADAETRHRALPIGTDDRMEGASRPAATQPRPANSAIIVSRPQSPNQG